MSRRAQKMLAAAARKAADDETFVPVLLLSEVDVQQCSEEDFVQILTRFNEIFANRPEDQQSAYVKRVYYRMLQLLSQQARLPLDKCCMVVNQYTLYYPEMAILTLDDLKNLNAVMEKRPVIIHFDCSASMSLRGFDPLVETIVRLGRQLESHDNRVYVSLFGDSKQQRIHANFHGRLLTLEEFSQGNYRPNGDATEFRPSLTRTQNFPTPYDTIIVSDGDFTDQHTQFPLQPQCRTVFFVAPPWSPSDVEQRHAQALTSCVRANVPYIGIASVRYPQLETIIGGFLCDQQFSVHLADFVHIGGYAIPQNLLAPTRMIQVFNSCVARGEAQLQVFVKKIMGLFRYLEETAQLNFERCMQGDEFRSLLSLVTPLIKLSQGHLETSSICQQLYGYLTKILSDFGQAFQKLMKISGNNPKTKIEFQKLWDDAMSFSERTMIIEENSQRYGKHVAFLNVHANSLSCTSLMLSEALQQLKTIYSPGDADLLSLIFQILAMSRIDDQPPCNQENFNILIWRKSDGTVDLLSILRQLPLCLQQYQHSNQLQVDRDWTLQPLTALRLAWVMDASGRDFPDFIMQALPSLVVHNKYLTDLDQDENRSAFWMKILRELAPKLGLPPETLQNIHQILTAHALKSFVLRLTAGSVTYQKQIYENAAPFIDIDDPMAWCIFVNEKSEPVDPRTGHVVVQTNFITDKYEVERWYTINLRTHGSTIRPRYLSKQDFANFPDDAIELYGTASPKDVDILRNQIEQSSNGSYSSAQINAHIYTIRNRLKKVPYVTWGMTERIQRTVTVARNACQGTTLPTEQVVINITRLTTIEYLISRSDDRFVAGVLHGLIEFSRVASQQMATGATEIDYAIECGQKAMTEENLPHAAPFLHLDKPGVREYLEGQYKKLTLQLRSVVARPQFESLPTLLRKVKATAIDDALSSMADLEALPERVTTAQPTRPSARVTLDQELFTCPITLDIMENPATTSPCGHMFELSAINQYLRLTNICPSCRTVVTGVTQNFAFKNVIEAWLAQQNP
ncbi:unnamed protein product [Rotaria sp. Silwood1]|nr:unnamed protein product [Rotaria sp. Silwood1]CAF5095250.1 unnamed protein product [Rotaria sp. Silwood1]